MYILIMFFHVNSGSNAYHIEFDTLAACEKAQNSIIFNTGKFHDGPVWLGCYPKGKL